MRKWKKRKRRRKTRPLPELSATQILAWADAHHARTGGWPNVNSGEVYDAPDEKWRGLDTNLRQGHRGLPGGTSLARLLAQERGVRNLKALPDLSVPQILAWADAWHARTGRWPTRLCGPIPQTLGETWAAVQAALANGQRGLPGGSSLSVLLAEQRGVRNHMDLPPLTVGQILAWADAHFVRTGRWPREDSGPVTAAPGETWCGVDGALEKGVRGLPGGSSLPRLLAGHRGVRNPGNLPHLDGEAILGWADACHTRTGRWPKARSGPIPEAPGETWMRVNTALREGLRGLPGGSSLAQLLAERRGVRNHLGLPRLSVAQVVGWAEAHRRRTGRWPTATSGRVEEAPAETWKAVALALQQGLRGLPRGSSLARLRSPAAVAASSRPADPPPGASPADSGPGPTRRRRATRPCRRVARSLPGCRLLRDLGDGGLSGPPQRCR
jgi:hypothetical protein